MTSSKIDMPQVPTRGAFALMLETACEQFEVLQLIISGEIKIVSDYLPTVDPRSPASEEIPKALKHLRAPICIKMALAKSFVAHAWRARTICDEGKGSLFLDRTERRLFLSRTKALRKVRDVNEHGFDFNTTFRPSLHLKDGSYLPDTGVLALSPTVVSMGPLNLYEVYRVIARMREHAGYASLAGVDLHLWGPI
jgi:hypothetical protein